MAHKIVLKRKFRNKILKILVYLEKKWSQQVAEEYYRKVHRRLMQLIEQPFMGAPSRKKNNIRAILITKHHKMYYRIDGDKIVVLDLYDSRMDPEKNPYRVRISYPIHSLIF